MFYLSLGFMGFCALFWLFWLAMYTWPIRYMNPSAAKALHAFYPRFDQPIWFKWALTLVLVSFGLTIYWKHMVFFWLTVNLCFMMIGTIIITSLPFGTKRRNDLYIKSACWLSAYTRATAHVKRFFKRK